MFWTRGRRSARFARFRYFWYVSDTKLDMLLGQIGEPTWRRVTAELDLDVKLVGLKLTLPAVDRSLAERSWGEKVAVVEECLRRQKGIGDLTVGRGYFAADVEMAWQPCDDNETVLFCGSSGTLLLVLGGSIANLLGHPPQPGQIGSHPYALTAALRGSGVPGDVAGDVQAAERAVRGTPRQPVRFLAVAIQRGPLPAGSMYTEYLLGTPLYVEAADKTSA
jgi:hypothetical protein